MTAQTLQPTPSQRLAALVLASVATLATFSSMLGLAHGYHREQQLLAQVQAASQPVAAAAAARKPFSLRG